uniref:Arrestin C-terminal-like domain-containing protein n=1 Tax=Setaria digitata TaxID=48799 RepID=A0A915PXE6_9BILA
MALSSLSVIDNICSDETVPYHVDIFLSEKIYNPGDMIHGEPISSPSNAVRERGNQRSEYFSGIEIGNHKFEFTFQLPKNGLYTSFDLENCGGRVRYCINVQCFSYGRLVLKKTLVFPIVCPADPVQCPEALKSGCSKKRVEFRNGRYLDVELSISKRWLVPGEALPAQVYINNRSGKSIKFSHLSIQQHIFCLATHPITYTKEWFHDTLGVGMDTYKIPNGSAHKYVPKFNIPALVPGFEVDRCMTLDYALKLDIPIFIGTSSTTETNLAQKTKLTEETEPPPKCPDSPPPSYAECFSQLQIANNAVDHS